MGFKLKNIFKTLDKAFKAPQKAAAETIDPLLPEWAKKPLDKLDAMSGNNLGGGAFGTPSGSGGGSNTPVMSDIDTGRLDQATMDELSQKRLAKLGKYFTSPIGVLSGANTVNAKVFS